MAKTPPTTFVRPRGFSLIELLIAMTLGLALTTGIITVFSGNQRNTQINDAMGNMQESARFALDRLAEDIRLSGYQGCAHIAGAALGASGNPIIADNPPTANLADTAAMGSVVGNGNNWAPGAPMNFDTADADALPGTHALTLQFGGPEVGRLTGNQTGGGGNMNGAAPLSVESADDGPFEADVDDLLIVSDCSRAELFRVTAVASTPLASTIGHGAARNSTGAFSQPFLAEETQVLHFNSNVYYVAETGQENRDGDAIRALYRQSLPYDDPNGNPPTEIVQGVENLRLAFGISDGGGGGNLRYVVPGDAGYVPANIVAVRIGLLMSSWDRVAQQDDTNTYLLAGQAIAPGDGGGGANTHAGDKRMRLAFNTTVKIRNRRQ